MLSFPFQAIFLTRPCPRRVPCPGFKASSATPTTLASVIPLLARLPGWWETSTIPCEYHGPLADWNAPLRLNPSIHPSALLTLVECVQLCSLLPVCVTLFAPCLSSLPESPVCSLMPRRSCCTPRTTRAKRATRSCWEPSGSCRGTLLVRTHPRCSARFG